MQAPSNGLLAIFVKTSRNRYTLSKSLQGANASHKATGTNKNLKLVLLTNNTCFYRRLTPDRTLLT